VKSSSEQGFSLFEMIVVLVIMGILAAIAAPSWVNYVAWMRLKDEVSQAKSMVDTAQSESKRLKVQVNCSFTQVASGWKGVCRTADTKEIVEQAEGKDAYLVHVDDCRSRKPPQPWKESGVKVPYVQMNFLGGMGTDKNGHLRNNSVAWISKGVNRCWGLQTRAAVEKAHPTDFRHK
jgi:prepilin-type N-terminal cleavage/methylation domain-containing protein